jgi:hypothetical protein
MFIVFTVTGNCIIILLNFVVVVFGYRELPYEYLSSYVTSIALCLIMAVDCVLMSRSVKPAIRSGNLKNEESF